MSHTDRKGMNSGRPSRSARRRNTKYLGGNPIVRQPGKNGGKRTAVKRKDK
jgi:hypothetical protein